MKKPRWFIALCDIIAVTLMCISLWRLRLTGLTFVTAGIILVMALCLTRLSYLVFPRRRQYTVIEVVRPSQKVQSKWLG